MQQKLQIYKHKHMKKHTTTNRPCGSALRASPAETRLTVCRRVEVRKLLQLVAKIGVSDNP